MSHSRSCPKCELILDDSSPVELCPNCGTLIPPSRETQPASDTPESGAQSFELDDGLPSDPDRTSSQIPPTIPHEPAKTLRLPVYPDLTNYTQFQYLNKGGMGYIYTATQQPIGRRVAVKVMNALRIDDGNERFIREMRVLSKIQHPNVLPIYEVGECSHGPYFTMELASGGSLSSQLKTRKLSDREIVDILIQSAHGLHAIHEQGCIHRDIKPSNILLTEQGQVKIADFGLAKSVEDEELTVAGQVLGTPSYMSPEQAAGRDTTFQSDIYSLGVTAYYAFTKRPLRKVGEAETAETQTAPLMKQHRADICPVLDAIVQKSLAHRPEDRYATAQQFAVDLQNWQKGLPTIAKPLTRMQKVQRFVHRHRTAASVLLLLLFLAAGAAIAVLEANPKRQMERALARGEKVTIVGETGLPKWHEWKTGDAKVGRSVIEDGSPGFEILSGGLLALVDDPQMASYRFRVQLRHAGSDGTSRSSLGLFFGYETLTTNDGSRLDRWVNVSYSDIVSPAELKHPKIESLWALQIHEQLLHHRPDNAGFSSSNYGRLPFTATNMPATHNDWRQLAVDVTSGGFVVYFGTDENGQLRKVFATSAKAIEMKLNYGFADDAQLSPTRILGYRWSTRRPLGISAGHGTIAFRDAVIEPLPDEGK